MILNPVQAVNELFKDKYDCFVTQFLATCVGIDVREKTTDRTGFIGFVPYKYFVMYDIRLGLKSRIMYIVCSNKQEDIDEVLSILPEGAMIILRK